MNLELVLRPSLYLIRYRVFDVAVESERVGVEGYRVAVGQVPALFSRLTNHLGGSGQRSVEDQRESKALLRGVNQVIVVPPYHTDVYSCPRLLKVGKVKDGLQPVLVCCG